jgi:hypothetical protein
MSQRKTPFSARALCLLAVAMYALSFFLPTFADHERHYGYEAFFVAFASIFNPFLEQLRLYFITWLANPTLWFGLERFATGRCRMAFVAGVIATALSATLIPVTLLIADSERGILNAIGYMPNGYMLWHSSMGMFTLAAAVGWRSSLRPSSTPQTR